MPLRYAKKKLYIENTKENRGNIRANERFDVIVVGAGASGGPLAARLSEDAERSVLLLEAGPDAPKTEDFPKELLDASMIAGAMPGHPNNWGFTANIRPGLAYSVARGKILGGSTTLNGTYFIRAQGRF